MTYRCVWQRLDSTLNLTNNELTTSNISTYDY